MTIHNWYGRSHTQPHPDYIYVSVVKQTVMLTIAVVSGNGSALFGKIWLKTIKLNWSYIKHVCMSSN